MISDKGLYRNLLDDPDRIEPVLDVLVLFLPEGSQLDQDEIWNHLDENLTQADASKMNEDLMTALEEMAIQQYDLEMEEKEVQELV